MSDQISLVNAWIFLNFDNPSGTNYNSSNSCYQTLIANDVYQSVDVLYMCFATILPTSDTTVPTGDGSTYTIQIGAGTHSGGLTNQDYMNNILADAPANNPDILLGITVGYGKADQISQIFSNPNLTEEQAASAFAANVNAYMLNYGLSVLDFDWEYPVSDSTTPHQLALVLGALGNQIPPVYVTLSPNTSDNLPAAAVNANCNWLNLQMYGGVNPQDFVGAGIDSSLFGYGVMFAKKYQTAQEAYDDNTANYQFSIYTVWNLNPEAFVFAQAQQQKLYSLVFPSSPPC